jgi:hypothetical protein
MDKSECENICFITTQFVVNSFLYYELIILTKLMSLLLDSWFYLVDHDNLYDIIGSTPHHTQIRQ